MYSLCVCVCMYACMHACMYVCMYVCVCVYVCMGVCMYVYVCVCMYVMYVCMCVFICMSGADPGFLKGGGSRGHRIFHKHPPLGLGHCPRDVIRRKTPPLLDIHKHPPPPWTLSA